MLNDCGNKPLLRSSLDHFGWGISKATLPKGTGSGRTTVDFWKPLSWKVPPFDMTHSLGIGWMDQLIGLQLQCPHLWGGKMTREALRNLPGAETGLVRKYTDKRGRKRIAGIPGVLRSSQHLGCTDLVKHWIDLVHSVPEGPIPPPLGSSSRNWSLMVWRRKGCEIT